MPLLLLSGALAALSLGVLPLPLAARTVLAVLLGLLQLYGCSRRGWPLFRRLVLLLALLLLGTWGWIGRPHPLAADPVHWIPAAQRSVPVQLQAGLLQDTRPMGEGCAVLAELPQGRMRLRFRPCPQLQQGWRLQLEGRLQRLRSGPHPLLSGAAERLAGKGVWSELQVERWSLIARPPTPLADLRRRIAAELRRVGGEQPGGLLAALVLGQAMVPLPLSVKEAFRAAGLSHALAASGFHLSVLLGAVLLLTRRASALVRWPAAFGAMGLFGLLAGGQASVVRALLMGAMAFVLKESGRRSRPLALLLLCLLLMLLWRPSWLLDVGFQLSAAATAGLILSAGPLEERLGLWLPSWAAGAMAIPLAASLWTLPLQLLHFGVVPSYAVLANVLAAPLLTPLTLGAMAMALTAVLLPPLLAAMAFLLVPLAQLLLALTQLMAGLPLAQLPIGRLGPLLLLLALAGLLPWWLPAARRWRLVVLPLLPLALGLRLWQQSRDQLLLVRQAPRQWIVARHQGRAGLVSLKADPSSCRRAEQLAQGLGIARFDWLLLLDPLPAEPKGCWSRLALTTVDRLLPQQRLRSPGLEVSRLSADSQGLLLSAGRQRWQVLPDRQAWWSWRRQGRGGGSLWLGFVPTARERRELQSRRGLAAWWPPAGSTSGWHQS